MNYSKLFILFCFCLLFFNSCANVKDALQGKKTENSDEFLIDKKNPLVLPPNYDDLPEPKDALSEDKDDSDIKEIIQGYQESEDDEDTSTSKSIENFVLDNINKD